MLRTLGVSLFLLVGFSGVSDASDEIRKPFFDIFRKLIEPPKPPPAPVATVVATAKPAAPVIPPLQIQINGITGDEGNRVAIVTFKGQQMLLLNGDDKGEFNVISIDSDKIVVLHKAAQRRQEIAF